MTPEIDLQSPYFVPMLIGGLVLLVLLMRVKFIGALVRTIFTIALIGMFVLLMIERAPYDGAIAGIADRFKLDGQEVVGEEVQIRMSRNGHFMANVTINGVKRRMLIDSGATVTALSERTAAQAGLEADLNILPIMIQTANGTTAARTASVDEMRIGNIVARDLKVVVSPGLGNMDLLGMNFLSKLKSWRVEGRTLILVPHHPQELADEA